MPRRLTVSAEHWPLSRPFAIARGQKTAAEVVVAQIIDDDAGGVGRGECVPYARYGETVAGCIAAIERLDSDIAAGLNRIELLAAMPAGAARNAVDAALWDLAAKQTGRRAWQLVGVERPSIQATAHTIALDTAEAMAAAAARLAGRPLIKIKVDAVDVIGRVAAVRRALPAARLIVDANEGWSLAVLVAVAPALAALGVEMIEQPLPADADGGLAGLSLPVPLCADESCHTDIDLDRVAGGYQAVNVKLDKAGGLTAALRLAAAARRRGMTTMVGCMVATSLSMAPAVLLAGGARYLDLDGPWWLKRDRAPSMMCPDGRLAPPERALWG